jgi:hypothetical protein
VDAAAVGVGFADGRGEAAGKVSEADAPALALAGATAGTFIWRPHFGQVTTASASRLWTWRTVLQAGQANWIMGISRLS